VRIKQLTIEEQQFVIGALSMAQAEKLISTPDESTDYQLRAKEVVCAVLNNATKGTAGADQWTPENLSESFDYLTFNALHTAALEFSGLKAAASGEATAETAPAASTSPESAAA
jgi:hypothetical protein